MFALRLHVTEPSNCTLCRTVECLGILTGAQLFSLNKEELKAVCGEEGGRVFNQVSLQKAQLEVGRFKVLLVLKTIVFI